MSWQPSSRVPDAAVREVDASFARYRLALCKVERLAGAPLSPPMRWAEGPVWMGDARCLLWSDVPGNCMWRWDEETGAASVWRKPSGFANGNTRDRQGRLLTCEHGGRRVSRTEADGRVMTLADSFEGKKLNSPNDIAVASNDSIWFTDPTYGVQYSDGCGIQQMIDVVGRPPRQIGHLLAIEVDLNIIIVEESQNQRLFR